MANFHVLIPAAGAGSRMGSETPKQYLPLNGRPMIDYSLNLFQRSSRIASISLVVAKEDDFFHDRDHFFSKLVIYPFGGQTRAESVLNGLRAIEDKVQGDDWILVHDAARPGLTEALLHKLIDTLEFDSVGGLLAIPLADTLKREDENHRVAKTESRDGLWQAQTPQMFRYDLLRQALSRAGGLPTDEAQSVESMGMKPKLVQGELRNLKITFPQDLILAEAILAKDRETQE